MNSRKVLIAPVGPSSCDTVLGSWKEGFTALVGDSIEGPLSHTFQRRDVVQHAIVMDLGNIEPQLVFGEWSTND